MKAMHIDFLPRRRPSRAAWWLCAFTASGAFVAAACAVFAWQDSEDAAFEWHSMQAAAKREASLPPPAAIVPVPPPYSNDARALMREASFPVAAALAAIESVAVGGVLPVNVEMAADTRSVRLQVEYTDQALLMDYLTAINAGEPATRWVLVQARSATATLKGAAMLQSNW